MDLRRLGSTMFLTEMAISLHRKRAPICVTQPSRDSWNVYARFYAAGRKQMSEIMVGDRLHPGSLARGPQRTLAFPDTYDRCLRLLVAPPRAYFLQ